MQWLRFLLFPFAIAFDAVTRLRNLAFNTGILKQREYDIPVIAVGNLSTGGTGKTPMIEYLIRELKGRNVAVLSRGYGRTTNGFIQLNNDHSSDEVGDEPLQIKLKFPEVVVAVCEKRVDGIDELLRNHQLDIILLDDAFQHRYVKASRYVLLTTFDTPYFNDYLLPTGNLREARKGAARASDIVITKCPLDLNNELISTYVNAIKPKSYQKVYFSTICYEKKVTNLKETIDLSNLPEQITVVTGIANASSFISFLSGYSNIKHLEYPDHHRFTDKEIGLIKEASILITTEKDFVRLLPYGLNNCYYLEMKTEFLNGKIEL